jgi:oligopeptide/dipeptide ABC transporter ATP-binding protein
VNPQFPATLGPLPGRLPVLEVKDLRTHFFTRRGEARVLDGVDLELSQGEMHGLVGESGSGKSVTAYSILRLIQPPGRVVQGSVRFRGVDLLALSERELDGIRGSGIAMIFQQPRAHLNPVLPVGKVMRQLLRYHRGLGGVAASHEAERWLTAVGLPSAASILRRYPHELSGGMCQRVMIALALSCQPEVLLADEPTTALDVTIQRQVMDLLAGLRRRLNLTELLISHDLALVADVCDRVSVMYAGQVVERGPAAAVVRTPRHPYTQALVRSRPRLGATEVPQAIEGQVPDLVQAPPGCRFHPRCPLAKPVCQHDMPAWQEVGPDQWVRCHFWGEAS